MKRLFILLLLLVMPMTAKADGPIPPPEYQGFYALRIAPQEMTATYWAKWGDVHSWQHHAWYTRLWDHAAHFQYGPTWSIQTKTYRQIHFRPGSPWQTSMQIAWREALTKVGQTVAAAGNGLAQASPLLFGLITHGPTLQMGTWGKAYTGPYQW